jgi:hypothetical protein
VGISKKKEMESLNGKVRIISTASFFSLAGVVKIQNLIWADTNRTLSNAKEVINIKQK